MYVCSSMYVCMYEYVCMYICMYLRMYTILLARNKCETKGSSATTPALCLIRRINGKKPVLNILDLDNV
jgi:hypothetical protein